MTVECRSCGHITVSGSAVCGVCGVRRPGRNTRPLFAFWALVVFVIAAAGVLWYQGLELSVQTGIGVLIAATAAVMVRLLAPVLVRAPRPRPGSLVSQIADLQERVAQIRSQLTDLSDAFRSARVRKRTRLMAATLSRLKDSYLVLKEYHDRFDAQLQLLQFSLWMNETAAIVADWERGDLESISAIYNRLIGRADNCRVAFGQVLSGRHSSGAYARTSAAMRDGLRRVDAVGDAMVIQKARLALATVSPASLPASPPAPPSATDTEAVRLDSFVTEEILNTSEELQREYDRIIAEHELATP